MSYIKRRLEKVFKGLDSKHQVVLLTGPRQVGKLSMLRRLAEGQNRIYVTLSDISSRKLAKNDPEMFFQIYKPPMIIDDIHLGLELVPYIKKMCEDSKESGLFWLIGIHRQLAIDELKSGLKEKLGIANLDTLSLNEIHHKNSEKPIEFTYEALKARSQVLEKNDVTKIFDHIWHGGMPSLIGVSREKRKDFYHTYVDTYTMLDGAELGGITDFLKLRSFMEGAAAEVSGQVNLKTLAEGADISQPTSKEWLNLLVELGLIFLLEPLEFPGEKRLIKAPKLYFSDTGLSGFLSKWPDKESLMMGPQSDKYFENFVVSEIRKTFIQSEEEVLFSYYKVSSGKEIDVIVEKKNKLHPFLIRKTAKPDPREIKKFQSLEKAKKPLGQGGIICLGQEVEKIDENNFIIPCNLF